MNHTTIRQYGEAPYRVAVIHGGPGAPGSMAPVARQLSVRRGILEPLQTADSVDGQVRELINQLEVGGQAPYDLIGASWGGFLSIGTAVERPDLVSRLILVGCAPLEECQAQKIEQVRLDRMTSEEVHEVQRIMGQLLGAKPDMQNQLFGKLGSIFTRVDAYDPILSGTDYLEPDYNVYHRVWPQAARLRQQGIFLKWAKALKCPVWALHGEADPHPIAGVCEPLTALVGKFTCIELARCGHTPWIERHAKDAFFNHLEKILSPTNQ